MRTRHGYTPLPASAAVVVAEEEATTTTPLKSSQNLPDNAYKRRILVICVVAAMFVIVAIVSVEQATGHKKVTATVPPFPAVGYTCYAQAQQCAMEVGGAYADVGTCQDACWGWTCNDTVCTQQSGGNHTSEQNCETACWDWECLSPAQNNYSCIRTAVGNHSSLATCTADCAPPITTYTCSNNGTCVLDASGEYSNITSCEANCTSSITTYTCDNNGTHQCVLDAGGEYSNVTSCESECWWWDCVNDVCSQHAHAGNYSTNASCVAVCGVYNYSCTVNSTGQPQCVVDATGVYNSYSSCDASCELGNATGCDMTTTTQCSDITTEPLNSNNTNSTACRVQGCVQLNATGCTDELWPCDGLLETNCYGACRYSNFYHCTGPSSCPGLNEDECNEPVNVISTCPAATAWNNYGCNYVAAEGYCIHGEEGTSYEGQGCSTELGFYPTNCGTDPEHGCDCACQTFLPCTWKYEDVACRITNDTAIKANHTCYANETTYKAYVLLPYEACDYLNECVVNDPSHTNITNYGTLPPGNNLTHGLTAAAFKAMRCVLGPNGFRWAPAVLIHAHESTVTPSTNCSTVDALCYEDTLWANASYLREMLNISQSEIVSTDQYPEVCSFQFSQPRQTCASCPPHTNAECMSLPINNLTVPNFGGGCNSSMCEGMEKCNQMCTCVPHTMYSCDTLLYQCMPNATGEYNSEASCEAGCAPPITTYTCESNGMCMLNASGEYSNITSCEANCTSSITTYACESNGTCVLDAGGEYSNVTSCNASCVPSPSANCSGCNFTSGEQYGCACYVPLKGLPWRNKLTFTPDADYIPAWNSPHRTGMPRFDAPSWVGTPSSVTGNCTATLNYSEPITWPYAAASCQEDLPRYNWILGVCGGPLDDPADGWMAVGDACGIGPRRNVSKSSIIPGSEWLGTGGYNLTCNASINGADPGGWSYAPGLQPGPTSTNFLVYESTTETCDVPCWGCGFNWPSNLVLNYIAAIQMDVDTREWVLVRDASVVPPADKTIIFKTVSGQLFPNGTLRSGALSLHASELPDWYLTSWASRATACNTSSRTGYNCSRECTPGLGYTGPLPEHCGTTQPLWVCVYGSPINDAGTLRLALPFYAGPKGELTEADLAEHGGVAFDLLALLTGTGDWSSKFAPSDVATAREWFAEGAQGFGPPAFMFVLSVLGKSSSFTFYQLSQSTINRNMEMDDGAHTDRCSKCWGYSGPQDPRRVGVELDVLETPFWNQAPGVAPSLGQDMLSSTVVSGGMCLPLKGNAHLGLPSLGLRGEGDARYQPYSIAGGVSSNSFFRTKYQDRNNSYLYVTIMDAYGLRTYNIPETKLAGVSDLPLDSAALNTAINSGTLAFRVGNVTTGTTVGTLPPVKIPDTQWIAGWNITTPDDLGLLAQPGFGFSTLSSPAGSPHTGYVNTGLTCRLVYPAECTTIPGCNDFSAESGYENATSACFWDFFDPVVPPPVSRNACTDAACTDCFDAYEQAFNSSNAIVNNSVGFSVPQGAQGMGCITGNDFSDSGSGVSEFYTEAVYSPIQFSSAPGVYNPYTQGESCEQSSPSLTGHQLLQCPGSPAATSNTVVPTPLPCHYFDPVTFAGLDESTCNLNDACRWVSSLSTCIYKGTQQLSCMQDSAVGAGAETLSLSSGNICPTGAASATASNNECGACKACYGNLTSNGRRYQIDEACCGFGGCVSRAPTTTAYITDGPGTNTLKCYDTNPLTLPTTLLTNPTSRNADFGTAGPTGMLQVEGSYYGCNGDDLTTSPTVCNAYPHCVWNSNSEPRCNPRTTLSCPASLGIFFDSTMVMRADVIKSQYHTKEESLTSTLPGQIETSATTLELTTFGFAEGGAVFTIIDNVASQVEGEYGPIYIDHFGNGVTDGYIYFESNEHISVDIPKGTRLGRIPM